MNKEELKKNRLEKAKRLLSQGKVLFAGQGKWFEYWDITNHTILWDKKDNTISSCTCSDCSISQIPKGLPSRCCYTLAVELKKEEK